MNTPDYKDGGPAFPARHSDGDRGSYNGMSLRDWFAGQAAAGACSTYDGFSGDKLIAARWCYEVADAMLEERKETSK